MKEISTILIVCGIALVVLFSLVIYAAWSVDVKILMSDRYADRIVKEQIEAAEAFDKGLAQGLKEDNTND
jgi:hypothetical protein